MTFDAKAFREEALEAMARAMYARLTSNSRDEEPDTWDECSEHFRKQMREIAATLLTALSAVARQHGVKMLAGESTEAMREAGRHADHCPIVPLLRRG